MHIYFFHFYVILMSLFSFWKYFLNTQRIVFVLHARDCLSVRDTTQHFYALFVTFGKLRKLLFFCPQHNKFFCKLAIYWLAFFINDYAIYYNIYRRLTHTCIIYIISVCVCVCIYIYIYIYIYIHTHTHLHTRVYYILYTCSYVYIYK